MWLSGSSYRQTRLACPSWGLRSEICARRPQGSLSDARTNSWRACGSHVTSAVAQQGTSRRPHHLRKRSPNLHAPNRSHRPPSTNGNRRFSRRASEPRPSRRRTSPNYRYERFGVEVEMRGLQLEWSVEWSVSSRPTHLALTHRFQCGDMRLGCFETASS